MSTQNKPHSGTKSRPCPDTPEPHHGDLRKRAYLKRRDAYQMQAQEVPVGQAGAMRRKRRSPA